MFLLSRSKIGCANSSQDEGAFLKKTLIRHLFFFFLSKDVDSFHLVFTKTFVASTVEESTFWHRSLLQTCHSNLTRGGSFIVSTLHV